MIGNKAAKVETKPDKPLKITISIGITHILSQGYKKQ
jgi:hypothetical protein